MISFAKEPFQVVEDNFLLIKEHWDEVVEDSRTLDPWWELFRAQEKDNRLVCFVVRNEKQVIGYAVFQLQPNYHSRKVMAAYNDAIFLKKEFRKSGLGKSFLKYCDEELEKIGINMIIWHVKPAVDYSGTLKAIGYSHHATIYARNIGG